MTFNDVKNFTFSFLRTLTKSKLLQAFLVLKRKVQSMEKEDLRLRNKLEDMEQEVLRLQETNQGLKNKVCKLEGKPKKPNIKPPTKFQKAEESNKRGRKKNKKHKKGTKNDKIEIHELVELKPDLKELPEDAKFVGTREVCVQDVEIRKKNIKFIIHRFWSKSEQKVYEEKIPAKYQGSEFGPEIWALIKHLHFGQRVPQNLIWKMLVEMGVNISEGQVNNIIIRDKGIDFAGEMEEAREAGLKKENVAQMDDTGARVKGENAHTIALVNKRISYFTTSKRKDKISCVKAMIGRNELRFVLNRTAMSYIRERVGNKVLLTGLKKQLSKRVYTEEEFLKEILNKKGIKEAIPLWKKQIKDGCVIGGIRSNKMGFSAQVMLSDGAYQYKYILGKDCECWVHQIRHYKKLEPKERRFRRDLNTFMKKWKTFYKGLLKYKKRPTKRERRRLEKWFDKLFSEETGYEALNDLKSKTLAKKDLLLLVLDCPWIPLHNNDTEGCIRKVVIQRNIQHKHDTWEGARVNDLYLSLMETCRKLGVSFGEYLRDRLHHRDEIPPLAQVIASSDP